MEQLEVSVFHDEDFTSSSFSEFESMRENGEFIDCKIALRNRCLKAHRLILAARIPLFRKVLHSSARGVIRIEEELNPDILESVINFAYTGSVEITTDNVEVLLSVSGYLEMNKVYDACWQFLEARLCHDNVWQTRMLAKDHGRSTVVQACDNYIKENFDIFSKSDCFLSLPFSYLREAIAKSDIKVSTEENVFEAVISWVRFSPSTRKDYLHELLQSIRVYRLAPQYLIERVSKEKLVRASLPCRDWLDEAKNYHLSSLSQDFEYRDSTSQPNSEERLPSPVSYASNPDFGIYAACISENKLFVKFLDAREKKWITLSQTCLDCVYHVFAIDTNIYVFCQNSTEMFDVKTLKWHSLETKHGFLHSAAIVTLDDVVYSCGGAENLAHLVRFFDVRQNEWITESQMEKPRMFSGATTLDKTILVTGGTFCIFSNGVRKARDVYNDAECYNPETKTWGKLPSMLHCRYDHGCTNLDDKVYVCGGLNSTFLDTAEMYDPSTNNWTNISPLNAAKRLFSVIPYDGKLYTLSKWQHAKGPAIDVYIYDPVLDMWTYGLPISGRYECNDAFLVCSAIPAETEVKESEEGPDLI